MQFFISTVCLVAASVTGFTAVTYEPTTVTPPKPRREFRGAWVATVKNIDWPSKPGLSTAEQKAQLVAMLDRAAGLKINAIIFQVRPMCDAFYSSSLEPWSPYLTGTMGKAPHPFYDPLEFAVAEAHKRGLELHAWFNPYRALVKAPDIKPSASHISNKRPDLVRDYGQYLWLDPGEQEVQNWSSSVVLDVVRRYDLDGVHFDDYFYPYPERGRDGLEVDFPDSASWRKSGAGRTISRDDWRRENVNQFISRVHKSIKKVKPWVKFGISPFGIWRPGYPRQIEGFDAYEKLYADSRKWLASGWVDYFVPQLYWQIDPPEQSFPALLGWWAEQNKMSRQLWVGMNTAKTESRRRSWPSGEIMRQIEIARRQSGVSGHLHWNLHSLLENGSLARNLEVGLYADPALIPPCPWLGSVAPAKPTLSASFAAGKLKLSWKPGGDRKVWLWLLQIRRGGKWTSKVLPGDFRGYELAGETPEAMALSGVDRTGNISPPTTLARK